MLLHFASCWGLNILTGYAGQLSLGSAAFMAVGAFGAYNLVLRVPGTLCVHDITRDGRVLMTEDTPQIVTMALPPGETHERNVSWFDWSLASGLSPDGTTLTFDESGEAATLER